MPKLQTINKCLRKETHFILLISYCPKLNAVGNISRHNSVYALSKMQANYPCRLDKYTEGAFKDSVLFQQQ